METTRCFLVRHGEVADAWRGRIYGNLDVELSANGRSEAGRVAQCLRDVDLDQVLSSGLARAEFGAECLRAGRKLRRRDETDLREIDRGEWAGLTWEELERKFPGVYANWLQDPGHLKPARGENLTDLAERVLPCLDRIAREFAGGNVAVVAHSWVIRVTVCHALGLSPGAATRFDLPTGKLVGMDWPVKRTANQEPRPVLAGFNLDAPPQTGSAWFRGPGRNG